MRAANHAPPPFRDRHTFKHGCIEIRCVLDAHGSLQRSVVVTDERARRLLGQPRSRPIASLQADQTNYCLRTSELWALAEEEAWELLARIQSELDAKTAIALGHSEALSMTTSPARSSGKDIQAVNHTGEARGVLLNAGPHGNSVFAIDLYDVQTRTLRRIEGIDLARAIEEAAVDIFDTVRIVPRGRHDVAISERSTDSRGTRSRSFRRSRDLYDVFRCDPILPAARHSDAAAPRFALRAVGKL